MLDRFRSYSRGELCLMYIYTLFHLTYLKLPFRQWNVFFFFSQTDLVSNLMK